MMHGRTPFYDKNRKLMFYRIINTEPSFPPTFSPEACTCIRGRFLSVFRCSCSYSLQWKIHCLCQYCRLYVAFSYPFFFSLPLPNHQACCVSTRTSAWVPDHEVPRISRTLTSSACSTSARYVALQSIFYARKQFSFLLDMIPCSCVVVMCLRFHRIGMLHALLLSSL